MIALALALAVAAEPLATGADFRTHRICTRARWCWESPPHRGPGIAGLWRAAPDDVWAIAGHGTVLRWDGRAWSGCVGLVDADLQAVWGAGARDVWLVGARGTVLRWDGEALRRAEPPADEDFRDVQGTGPDDVWILGKALHHWDGARWTTTRLPERAGPPFLVRAPGEVWVTRSPDGLLSFDGKSFHALPGPDKGMVLRLSGPSAPWLLASPARLYRWRGDGWEPQEPPGAKQLTYVYAPAANDVWAFGEFAGAYHFDGQAWTHPALGQPPGVRAATGERSDLWLGQFDGSLARWNGRQLERAAPIGCDQLKPALPSSSPGVWALGRDGVCERKDGRWSPVSLDVKYPTMLFARTRGDAWLAAGRGLFHWNGEFAVSLAANPDRLPSGGLSGLTAIWARSEDDAWAVGRAGLVARWNGRRWDAVPSGVTADLRAVWGSAADDVWMVGDRGTALHWNGSAIESTPTPKVGGPGVWKTARGTFRLSGAEPLSLGGVWGRARNDVFAVGDVSAMQVAEPRFAMPMAGRDGGPPAAGAPQPAGWGAALLHWDGERWSPIPTGDVIALASLTGSGRGDAWAGGPDALFHFDGTSWKREDTGAGAPGGTVLRDGEDLLLFSNGEVLIRHAP